MKIRTKISFLSAGLIVLCAILVFFQYRVEKQGTEFIINGIRTEERQSFSLLINLAGSDLAFFAGDYSYWDEMVNYVRNPDPKFAEENIAPGLVTFNASEAYVFDAKRNLVYGKDLAHAAEAPYFSEEQWKKMHDDRLSHFFAYKNDEITEFRVATIHPTNDPERRTEPVGYFVVGKHWDREYLSKLEEISGVRIFTHNEEVFLPDTVSISFPYVVMDWKGEVFETYTIVSPHPLVSSVEEAASRRIYVVIFSSLLILLLVHVSLELLIGRPMATLARGIEKKDIPLMRKMQAYKSEFGTLAKLVLGFSEHEEMLEAKAKDEAILSAVGSGLIAINKDKKITLFNAAAEKMIGLSAERALGAPIGEIFKAETHEGSPLTDEESPFNKALREKMLINRKVMVVRNDGSKFPAMVTAAPVLLHDSIIGVVQDLRDVSAEESLERSKSEFISLVSHELRTPLTSLEWTVEKIEKDENIPRDIIESVIPSMRKALERIKTLATSMVEVSKIETGSLMTASINTEISVLIGKSLEELRPVIETKKLRVSNIDETDNHDMIKTDERLFRIILSNLISNAAKYSDVGGEISIITRKEADHFLISVANTGPGIPNEEQPRIFTKLYRATNARLISPDGVGLGLYISKSFLEKLGGELSFVSSPGEKTTFTIKIPSVGV